MSPAAACVLTTTILWLDDNSSSSSGGSEGKNSTTATPTSSSTWIAVSCPVAGMSSCFVRLEAAASVMLCLFHHAGTRMVPLPSSLLVPTLTLTRWVIGVRWTQTSVTTLQPFSRTATRCAQRATELVEEQLHSKHSSSTAAAAAGTAMGPVAAAASETKLIRCRQGNSNAAEAAAVAAALPMSSGSSNNLQP